ncbi:hypothetical protein BKA93DRAFT_714786, partial [Sparassis latifolia]
MIARCRAKCWVIQLKEENQNLILPNSQRGVKGHIIIYPQHPENIAEILPPPLEDIVTPICVIFVGSSLPSAEWLREKAKPLIVRREKVRNALLWLKQHNMHYKDIKIDQESLNSLAEQQILPFKVEHVLPDESHELLTSRYDTHTALCNELAPSSVDRCESLFQNVVVTDIDANAPANEIRAAAVRHLKQNNGSYLQIPHDPKPMNEFFNSNLFPLMYPTLYPYSVGGFEDLKCSSSISLIEHTWHL